MGRREIDNGQTARGGRLAGAFAFSFCHVPLLRWDSRAALERHLDEQSWPTLLLAKDAQSPHKFWSAALEPERDGIPVLALGVCDEGHGVEPRVYCHVVRKALYCIFNCSFAIIDLQSQEVAFCYVLESPCYEVLLIEDKQVALVVFETGVACFDLDGNKHWEYASDIIGDFRLVGARLELDTMDGERILLDSCTGSLLV